MIRTYLLWALKLFTFITFPFFFGACAQTDFKFQSLLAGENTSGDPVMVHFYRVCRNVRSQSPRPFFEDPDIPGKHLTLEIIGGTGSNQGREETTGGNNNTLVRHYDLSNSDMKNGPFERKIYIDENEIRNLLGPDNLQKRMQLYACTERDAEGRCRKEPNYNLGGTTSSFRVDQIPSDITIEVFSVRWGRVENGDCDVRRSPLVLDLNGDGFNTVGPNAGVTFDLAATGTAVRTGWVAGSDDAFLVRDINGDGRITTGAELFGDATRLPNGTKASNGFEALKALDSNRDLRFSPADWYWGEVMLWIDRNVDGVSQPQELYAMEDQEVLSIDLDYVEMLESDPFGNQTRQRSAFEIRTQFGSSLRHIIDLWFKTLPN